MFDSVQAGDRVVLSYDNPLRLHSGDRTGTVDRVTDKVVTMKVDEHGGKFRSYSRQHIKAIRRL